MRRAADNALWGKDAHLASHLSPAASLEALQQRCPQHRHLNVLRVPKAGSTSFTEMLSSACGKSRGSNQVVELPTSSSVSGSSLASGGGTSPPAPPPWSLSTLWAHSGYEHPKDSSAHDRHHNYFDGNYGHLGLLDWLHGTSVGPGGKWNYRKQQKTA